MEKSVSYEEKMKRVEYVMNEVHDLFLIRKTKIKNLNVNFCNFS